MSKLISFSFLLIASIASNADAKPTTHFSATYADWDVICDNVNRCEAITMTGVQGVHLNLVRDAGPNSTIQLSLRGAFTEKAIHHVYLDNKKIRLENFSTETTLVSGDVPIVEFSNDNESEVIHLLRTMSSHKTLSIKENSSSEHYNISLAGLAKSLSAIDERQGRKYNETAISQTSSGNGSRTNIPHAPLAPTIKVRPYKNHLNENEANLIINTSRKKFRDKECSHGDEPYSDHAYAISANQALVLLECRRGAYNRSHHAFTVIRNEKSPQMKPMLLPSLPNAPKIGLLFNTVYDAKSGTLSQFRKTRGVYDCGNKIRWAFDGVIFRLFEYREYELCKNGEAFEFPRQWHAKLSYTP